MLCDHPEVYSFALCLPLKHFTATRNKYVVVGLGGATIRMGLRLDSNVLKTLPQGSVRGAVGAIMMYTIHDNALKCRVFRLCAVVSWFDRVVQVI